MSKVAREIVAAIKVNRYGVERRLQQRRVVPVGGRRDRPERDAAGVNHRGPLESLFTPIHGASARHLAPARRFGDAALDRHIGQLQSDHPIMGLQHDPAQVLHNSAAIHSSRRRRSVVAEQVASAMRQYAQPNTNTCTSLSKTVRNARAMGVQGMIDVSRWQQVGELIPNGVDDACFDGGHKP